MVTGGPERKPLKDVTVSLSQDHSFEWLENGQSQSGSLGRQWWIQTDDGGRAVTRASAAELEAHIYQPDWKPDTKTEVRPGQTTTIRFHRENFEKRTIAGQIKLPVGSLADLYGAEVRIVPLDDETVGETKATVDSDGNFSFETTASRIGAYVKTTDGLAAGVLIADVSNGAIELELLPTVEHHGYMIDGNGKPMSGKWVRAVMQLQNPGRSWQNSPRFVKSVYDVDQIEATTDEAGRFVLKGVSPNIPFQLSCQDERNGERGRRLGKRLIRPGEQRPAEEISFAARAPAARPASIADHIDGKLADCQATGIHLLVALSGDGEGVADFVRSTVYNDDKYRELINYLPVWIDATSAREKPDRREYFRRRNWDVPGENEILLAVLDGQGNELAKKLIDITSEQAADLVHEFAKTCAPKKMDAQQKFDAALAEARRSGRKVWARISQTRCAPCFKFSRWLETNREILERDYVLLKVDDVRDENGIAVARKMLGKRSAGVPYHQILDADGSVLIDSIGPLGNIGHPGDFESRQYLRKMLESTAKNLGKKEIGNLVDSLDK